MTDRRTGVSALLAAALVGVGCGASPADAPLDAEVDAEVDGQQTDGASADTIADVAHDTAPNDAAHSDAHTDAHGDVLDAADAGPLCRKHLTVLFSVGVGAGALDGHSNGCWSVLDADGAANHSFRKCSTSTFVVSGPTRPNYAYDDTSPNHDPTQERSFLDQCSAGATGDGFEFMAYRSGWRVLSAPHLRAYFAELYGDATDDVDSLWKTPGVYTGNATLAAHAHVYPMINIGPPRSAGLEGLIEKDALAICKAIDDGGYFGTYVATWADGMDATDPRVLGLAKALNACTAK